MLPNPTSLSTGWILVALLILLFLIIVILASYFDAHRWTSINTYYDRQLIYYDQHYAQKIRVSAPDRVVISLTTTPERIVHLKPTLVSLLDSTRRVDEIRINLPYISKRGQPYVIPKWLESLKSIRLARIEQDWGPGSKIYPALLEEDPQTVIIAIDDDMIYGSSLIENLVAQYYHHGGQAVITTTGQLASDYVHKSKLSLILDFLRGPQSVEVVRGVSGFVLSPALVPKEVFDLESGPPEAVWVDDDWLSGWLKVYGVPVYQMGSQAKSHFIPNMGSMCTAALIKTVNADDRNSCQVWEWFAQQYPQKIKSINII